MDRKVMFYTFVPEAVHSIFSNTTTLVRYLNKNYSFLKIIDIKKNVIDNSTTCLEKLFLYFLLG